MSWSGWRRCWPRATGSGVVEMAYRELLGLGEDELTAVRAHPEIVAEQLLAFLHPER